MTTWSLLVTGVTLAVGDLVVLVTWEGVEGFFNLRKRDVRVSSWNLSVSKLGFCDEDLFEYFSCRSAILFLLSSSYLKRNSNYSCFLLITSSSRYSSSLKPLTQEYGFSFIITGKQDREKYQLYDHIHKLIH